MELFPGTRCHPIPCSFAGLLRFLFILRLRLCHRNLFFIIRAVRPIWSHLLTIRQTIDESVLFSVS
jgi:hypothetical protein